MRLEALADQWRFEDIVPKERSASGQKVVEIQDRLRKRVSKFASDFRFNRNLFMPPNDHNTIYRLRGVEDALAMISIGPSEKGDEPAMAVLYRKVEIHPRNIETKLDPSNPQGWMSVGGMFTALDDDAIKAERSEKEHHFLVVRNHSSEIIGLASYCLRDELPPDICFYKDAPVDEYLHSTSKGMVATGLDMVIAPEYSKKAIPAFVMYELQKQVGSGNYDQLVFEVYSITGIAKEGGEPVSVEFPNPVAEFHKQFDAKKLAFYHKDVYIAPYTLRIRSDVYMQPTVASLSQLGKRIAPFIIDADVH